MKGCHSSNSENKQDLSSGGKLHPVPKHALDDPEQQKKWIELVKVNIHSGAFLVRITRNNPIWKKFLLFKCFVSFNKNYML